MAGVLLIAMLLVLLRAANSVQLFDQILAINTFGTLTILLIIAIGTLSGRAYFIDVALLYALVNFVATIALLTLFNTKGVGWLSFFKNLDKVPDD